MKKVVRVKKRLSGVEKFPSCGANINTVKIATTTSCTTLTTDENGRLELSKMEGVSCSRSLGYRVIVGLN